jgi:hypothetical protein
MAPSYWLKRTGSCAKRINGGGRKKNRRDGKSLMEVV